MLYFLLIIIAIGILLASEDGKWLLYFLLQLSVVVGGLYLVFWIIMLAIAFFTSKTFTDTLLGIGSIFIGLLILAGIVLVFYISYCSIKTLKNKVNKKYPRISLFWHKYKKIIKPVLFTVFILLISTLIALMIYYINPQ